MKNLEQFAVNNNITDAAANPLAKTPAGPEPAPLPPHNSFNSCAPAFETPPSTPPPSSNSSNWSPGPIEQAAFHGLAGEIVGLIAPQTEADPVALLVQFLAAFGSIIGRTAYFLADGARHYMNLFAVLVGATSKGRKGTSWNQILSLLRSVDDVWVANCVTSGLSSGEGLIYNVRDQVIDTNPPKKRASNGEHTGPSIKDPGVRDKRLLVQEGEFANVLKVMAREGNTLSPVIRQAWETGTLKTMVKNSPNTATDAHISIVGHITRDEGQRLLNQTEAANGFGNRFLWPVVKRSQLLPEGGYLDPAFLNPVIAKVQKAIQFARTAGEIRRAEPTRQLWWAAYAELSGERPGMFGAVTARAEAQVARLSAMLALLDCSNLIQPEHHHAAMAL